MGLMLGHNLTPHSHDEQSAPHQPMDLGDWLEVLFQFDHGEGHLEYFAKSCELEARDIIPAPVDLTGAIVAVPNTAITKEANVYQLVSPPPIPERIHCHETLQRGPPAIS